MYAGNIRLSETFKRERAAPLIIEYFAAKNKMQGEFSDFGVRYSDELFKRPSVASFTAKRNVSRPPSDVYRGSSVYKMF